MVRDIIELIKIWLLTKALTTPLAWICLLALFSIILLFLAIFVKFKNGWISLIGFFAFELIGVIAVISLTSNNILIDNLNLDKGEVVSFNDVTSRGIVVKRRFISRTIPLLGIQLPEKDSKFFNDAKEVILSSRFSNSLIAHYSSVYSGAVLYDSSGNCINEVLLEKGLASTCAVSPKQYIHIQEEAIKLKSGIWSIQSIKLESTSIIDFSYCWLIFIESVSLALVGVTWLKRQVLL